MADRRVPDINADRNSDRISTEEAKRRAEPQARSEKQSSTAVRHGGAGKMGMDRSTSDVADTRGSDVSKESERAHWPDEDGNLEESSGHP